MPEVVTVWFINRHHERECREQTIADLSQASIQGAIDLIEGQIGTVTLVEQGTHDLYRLPGNGNNDHHIP